MKILQKIRCLFKFGRHLAAVLILVGFVGTAWWGVHLPCFDFKSVTIIPMGNSIVRHINNSIVRKQVIEQVHGNFFTADLNLIREKFEGVAWVRAANVRREWPNKIIIEADEHRPLGTWADDGRILSTKGDVFIANLDEAEDETELYAFDGPKGAERQFIPKLIDFQKWFGSMNLKLIGIDANDRYDWSVKLEGGMIVDLGREDSSGALQARFERFRSVYPRLQSGIKGGLEYVDMRYPNGLSVKPITPIKVPKSPVALPQLTQHH